MDEIIKTAASISGDKIEHTKEAIAEANHLLANQADSLGDIMGLTEKINMSWSRNIQLHAMLAKQLNLSKVEEAKAKALVEASIGDEQDRAKVILASIQQRQRYLQHEVNTLRALNASVLTPMLYLFGSMVRLFLEMDKAATKFNIGMGLMRSDTNIIQYNAQKMAVNLMGVGVTIDEIYKSWESLASSFGSVYIVSTELVKTAALLKAQLGVSEENSAKFFRNMAFLSGKTMETQKNMAYIAADMSRAAGTKLDQVMADIATHTDTTLVMMSRIPEIAIKSAIEFRRLGTSLESVASASRHIFSFTENINEEMEASVLLGHSVNLQKARELAYHKDLEGSNREILKLAKQNRIEQMDPYQAEAFARATGRSVDELMGMVQADKEWTNARLNGTDAVKAQIAEYEKLHSANKDVLADRGKQFELELMQKSNQERIVAVTQKWHQLVSQLLVQLLPVVDAILSITPSLLTVSFLTLKILSGWLVFGKALEFVGSQVFYITNGIGKISDLGEIMAMAGQKVLNVFKIIGEFFGGIGTKLPAMFKAFSIFEKFGVILDIIPGLGEIIMAIQAIWETGKGVVDIFNLFKQGKYGEAILAGFELPFRVLKSILIQPFIDLVSWFWNKSGLAAHSPSKIGLSIVKGIISVGAMLYDALTYPFRHAFAWILDHIPGMGKMAAGLRGGFGGVATTINHKLDGVSDLNPIPQKAPSQAIEVAQEQVSTVKEQTSQNDDGNKLLQNILVAIQTLNKNLKDGGIAVNLDSQRLSSTLSKNLAFSGNFGSNQ